MADNERGAVAAFRPRPDKLLVVIRQAAADTKKVLFGEHALDRMEERGITTLDALRVLRTGEIADPPEPGRSRGEWKCKVTAPIKGNREIGVITVVMMSGRLFIKTVEWEDL